jgi:hypothetical protein
MWISPVGIGEAVQKITSRRRQTFPVAGWASEAGAKQLRNE